MFLAAAEPEKIKQLEEIYNRIGEEPSWSFKITWLLSIVITITVIMIFQRQKKIAQNQVDLARMIDDFLEKKGK